MKILLINYSDRHGGSGIASKRLTEALNKAGHKATLGVLEKKTDSPFVTELPKNENFKKRNAKIIKNKMLETTNSAVHSMNRLSKLSVKGINAFDCDVVHIGCVNGSTISIEDIAKIKKPIVWTLRDLWPICGAEHHPNWLENDRRFIEGYTKENFPKTSSGIDICRLTYERKKRAWKNLNFTWTALSNFQVKLLADSALFNGQSAMVTPNIIPTETFKPLNKITIRKMFNIPLDKKIIGFCSNGQIDGKKNIKGTWFLLNALKKIPNKSDYMAMVIGPAEETFLNSLPIKTISAGSISDERILAALYNCCDCFVVPSIIETFGNVVYEALACEIPVIAFNAHAMPDAITHKQTGYLAKPFQVKDLFNGILYCLENQKLLKKQIHKSNKTKFNEKAIVEKYLQVYREAVKKHHIGEKVFGQFS